MAVQFVALVDETTRGTDPGSGYLFLPVSGALQPSFSANDEPRTEFRGADTALGSSSVVRRDSQWTYTLECPWYPGAETGLLFKHLLGKVNARATVDTSGKKGILYPEAMPYGTGRTLVNKAIGIVVNSDEGGTTKARYFGGGRVKSCSIKGEGTGDIMLSFELTGPGEYIGAEGTMTAGAVFPTVSPFTASDLTCFIGSGITRTGTAPNYTALVPNTMKSFMPDSVDLTITNGLEDKTVMNGVQGPSKTTRAGQFSVEANFPIDYDDPASGFSSADEFKNLFTATATQSLLLLLDNGELAGTATENYRAVIDLPFMLNQAETPERNSEGTQPSVGLKYSSLYSATTKYPFGLLTVDKAATY